MIACAGILLLNRICAAEHVIIPQGTELVGELVTPIHSKESKKGDPIVFKVAQNLVLKDAVILEKGTNGIAKITRAEKATYFGQGGQVEFEPESINTVNGVPVPLTFKDYSKQRRGTSVNDANAAVAYIGLGVFGAFFHGKNQSVPAGTKFKFFVKQDTDLGVDEKDLAQYFFVLPKKAKN